MPPALGEDEPSLGHVLTVALATVSAMTVVMIGLGADPAETRDIAMEIIGLVIAYLALTSGQKPRFRP